MEFSLSRSSNKVHRLARNRLLSIKHDVQWVREVHEAYGGRPLVPNERCGLWYVDPLNVQETCYFKSTDGHTGQWQFSTRRLNFHLLDLLPIQNGIIVVDSTRRGKTMPDALSKTVPIWCAVINYIMMQGMDDDNELDENNNNYFFWPRQMLSPSEAHSIAQLIPQFAQRVLDLGLISPQTIRSKLAGKILRPLWVNPAHSLPFEPPVYDDFIPVICCVASERADDGERQMRSGEDGSHTFTYVQGAADDHELWASSLTPELFWKNFESLTDPRLNDEELEKLILEIGANKLNVNSDYVGSLVDVVKLTGSISVGKVVSSIDAQDIQGYNTVILLSGDYNFQQTDPEEAKPQTLLRFNCPPNKKGSNELRKVLPKIMDTIDTSTAQTLILCDNGTDLSIGVALAILSSRYNLQWQLQDNIIVTKDVIRRQLAKIMELKKANPSRATLQAINSFLM